MAGQLASVICLAGLLRGFGIALHSSNEKYRSTRVVDVSILAADELEYNLEVQSALNSMVGQLFEGSSGRIKTPSINEILNSLSKNVNVRAAAHVILEKLNLPISVAGVVKHVAKDGVHDGDLPQIPESQLTKARNVLNELVQQSQRELDVKIIECQTFKESNRGTHDQVVTDLARLGEQIADLERLKLEANNGVTTTKQSIIQIKHDMSTELAEHLKKRAQDQQNIAIKKKDLEVFQFILEFTKCESTSTLLFQRSNSKRSDVNICEHHNQLVLDFKDRELNARYARMLTPSARAEISAILGEIRAAQHSQVNLVEVSRNTSTPPPTDMATQPVLQGSGEGGEFHCPPTPHDCGILHDKIALIWGENRDQVDELSNLIEREDGEWDELHDNFGQQIKIITNVLNTYSAQLAEATANLNANHEEQRSKDAEKINIDGEFVNYMAQCKERIEWIVLHDICAIVVVRNAVMRHSTVCPTEHIVDCDVENWIPETCTKTCDDKCPHPDDPMQCGGWELLNRRVLQEPNECGLKCPMLSYQKKCNQIRCPVDCVMSEWSGYSKCTKDCEGGVQQRTRVVMTAAKNGGEFCENPTQQRACNTGSCDRDCVLSDWTAWSACSMACTPEPGEPGFSKRQRDVIVPTRGEGKCPGSDSDMRVNYDQCNVHPCTGDEECYAVQDLVIAIDGSGSISAENFDALKTYVGNLVGRYKGEVYNMELMRVGIVQFGNGEIQPDGGVSNAIFVLPLTSDMDAVADAVDGLQFLKGFTNMAQAFSLASTLFTEGGRVEAQSAIMVITDGKPSFTYQTQRKVDDLEEKGITRYFVTISDYDGKDTELMKKWASAPWYTNHIHIPGFAELVVTNQTYVQQNVVMFCPSTQSPQVCHATIYQHARFLGWQADFPEGAYDGTHMIERGAVDNDMSSVKVFGEGCVATLYESPSFTGWAVDYPEGWYDFREFIRQGAHNDKVSSLFVWKDDGTGNRVLPGMAG